MLEAVKEAKVFNSLPGLYWGPKDRMFKIKSDTPGKYDELPVGINLTVKPSTLRTGWSGKNAEGEFQFQQDEVPGITSEQPKDETIQWKRSFSIDVSVNGQLPYSLKGQGAVNDTMMANLLKAALEAAELSIDSVAGHDKGLASLPTFNTQYVGKRDFNAKGNQLCAPQFGPVTIGEYEPTPASQTANPVASIAPGNNTSTTTGSLDSFEDDMPDF